jgi:hypothetical protein
LSVVCEDNAEDNFVENFREDFVKCIDFDNEDYLIVFPDSTKIFFKKETNSYLGIYLCSSVFVF